MSCRTPHNGPESLVDALSLVFLSLPAFVAVGLLCAALSGLPSTSAAAASGVGTMPSPFPQVADAQDGEPKTPLDRGSLPQAPLPPSYPTKEFSAQESSPVLVISNLDQYKSVMHITTDVITHNPKAGQSYQKVPPFDVGNANITGLRLPAGMHAYGVPDFRLNHTAALEFKFWTPCDQEPEGVFELTLMPCFYSPFEPEEDKRYEPYFSHGQRGTMYIPHYVPEDLRYPSYAAYLEAQRAKRAAEAGNCTEDGVCELGPPETVRLNTRVDCWFPPHRDVEALATPINLIGHDHRVSVRDIVYQRAPATSPPSGESEVYYDTRIKEFPAKRLEPVPEAVKEAAHGAVPEIVDGAVLIDGVRYCRSTLQVFASDAADDSKLASEPVGWTIASPTTAKKRAN